MKTSWRAAMSGEREAAGLSALGDQLIAQRLARLGDGGPELELALELLMRARRAGHVCLDLAELAKAPFALPDSEGEGAPELPALAPWLAILRQSSLVREADEAATRPLVLEGTRLYLARSFDYERRLARALRARVEAPPRSFDAAILARTLDRIAAPPLREASSAPPELDRQRLAIVRACLRSFLVIAGGPGTGKTTTVKKLLLARLEQARAMAAPDEDSPGLRIALAAPTGKAAARLRESILEEIGSLVADEADRATLEALEATTVHRLLGPRGDSRSRFRHDAANPLPHDLVIIDEASMISLALMAKLVEAVDPAASLILLGDRNQLASVEVGAVLGDICGPPGSELRLSASARAETAAADPRLAEALAALPTPELAPRTGIADAIVTLDRVHRFDAQSGIAALARALQSREAPTEAAMAVLEAARARRERERDAPTDLEWIASPDPSSPALDRLRRLALAGYGPLIEGARRGDPADELLAQLSRLRITCAHRRGPNGVQALGARVESWLEAAYPGWDPRDPWPLGRPLMVTQNDHELGLYNGDVGVVVRHREDPSRREIAFADPTREGGVRYLSPARLPRHETVFTMSIHKSQGSQFEQVVVVLPRRSSRICTLELVYTGVTRARRALTLAADEATLRDALGRRVHRNSGLRDTLW